MEQITTFVLFLLQVNSVLCTTEPMFSEADLKLVVGIQNLFCAGSNLCGTYEPTNHTNYESILTVRIPEYIDGSCCKNCSCDADTCIASGTCCADIFDDAPNTQENVEQITATCEYAQFLPYSIPNYRTNGIPMMMARKCPNYFIVDNAHNSDIKDKCENPAKYDLLDVKVPVTDNITLQTFQNIYCAKCHSVVSKQLVKWDLFVECRNYGDAKDLYDQDIENVFQTVNASPACNIIYKEPKNKLSRNLTSCKYVIKECNITGVWDTYDPLIEVACHAYTSVFDNKYKNVFCALCNKRYISGTCVDFEGQVVTLPSFSALLRFNEGKENEVGTSKSVDVNCLGNQVFDRWKNECRNLSCRFPKTIRQGNCVNVVDVIHGASYQIYLKLRPDKPISIAIDGDFLEEVAECLDNYVKGLLEQLEIANMVYFYDAYYKKGTPINASDILTGYRNNSDSITFDNLTKTPPPLPPIPATFPPPPQPPGDPGFQPVQFTNSSSRGGFIFPTPDDSPETLGQPSISNIEYFLFYIKIFFVSTFDKSADVFDDVLRYDGHTELVQSNESDFSATFNLSLEDFGYDGVETLPKDINGNGYLEHVGVEYKYDDFYKAINPRKIFDLSSLVPEVLAEKTRCPLIEIKHDDLSVERRLNGIFLNELNLSVPLKYMYETNHTDEGVKYLICVHLYLKRVHQITRTGEVFPDAHKVTPQGIVSLVCTCLSLSCNIITLLAYSLFKELRSQPGINNICLVVCLTIAQAQFQFGLMQAENLGSISCIVLGVSIHFFWLMVMFWMNVSCFHMYKVFIYSTKTKRESGNCRNTTIYLIYCVFASAVFVAINITVSSVTSDNTEIGYSEETCYISRHVMVGLVFALPVGIVILINLTLFISVIVQISRTPSLKAESQVSRNYLKIYAKLSTITGITWIFGFLFFFTEETFLEYLFIIFNASQGFFLCFAFVINKRVMKLYKDRFGINEFKQNRSKHTFASNANKSANTTDTQL